MPQNIFDSDSSPAVPGGNLTKPLVIALLALLASRYMSGGQKQSAPAPEAPKLPDSLPGSAQDAPPGSILDGLGGLVKQFQQKGLGDAIDSWVNLGKNKSVAPDQVSGALGGDVVDELSRRTGLSKDQVVAELARMLPNVVDKLTPDGRLPTRQEIMRLMS
ncbi:MAG: YidB family protein [Methyloceanibacter sp.]|nr:YidB family protein [Methyloceanibacter sp.]